VAKWPKRRIASARLERPAANEIGHAHLEVGFDLGPFRRRGL
jgi:hypothetical protein